MLNTISKLMCAAPLAALLVVSAGCSKNMGTGDRPPAEGDYAIWLQLGSWPNTFQYILGAKSLAEGSVNLSGTGVEVTGKADYGIIPHKGFYYYPSTSSTNGRFSKFSFRNNRLTVEKEVPFTFQTGVTSYAWKDDNTLVLIGTSGEEKKVLYSVVDANTLEITNGELAVPPVPAGYQDVATRSVEYANGKLYIGLVYTAQWPAPAYPKMIVAVVNASSFAVETVMEDDRSVGGGNSDMWMEASFVDEKGDVYILASPGWMSTTLPSAVYRIKAGTGVFDPSYFFNINTSAIGGMAVGMWYVGNGQAIVKYEDPSMPADGSDAVHNMGFAVINAATGTVLKKLSNIPFDKGSQLASVLVENGKAYILANAKSEKDYVWEYDPATGNATPGLEVVGGYDYMLRLDKMK